MQAVDFNTMTIAGLVRPLSLDVLARGNYLSAFGPWTAHNGTGSRQPHARYYFWLTYLLRNSC